MSDHRRNRGKGVTTSPAAPALIAPEAGVSRRRFLSTGVGTALAVPALLGDVIAGAEAEAGATPQSMDMPGMEMPGQDSPDTIGVRAVPFTEGAPLVEPELRRSVGGELRTTLQLRYAYKDVGGSRLYMRTYEGMIPGPTLRLSRGDVLRIRIVNDLPPNRDPMPAYIDQPHHLNTTNLHFHGSHVSPSGISDNVMRAMEPGESYDVEIVIPADHTAGTYWYHPHHHGGADIQVASGMAGAIIIEGDFDDVREIATARERLLVLGEVVFDAFGMIATPAGPFPPVVGQRAPTPCSLARCGPGACSRGLSGRHLPGAGATNSTPSRATDRAAPDGQPEISPDHVRMTDGPLTRRSYIDLLVQAAPRRYELRGALRPGYPSRPRAAAHAVVGASRAMKLRPAAAAPARHHSRRGDHRPSPPHLLLDGAGGGRQRGRSKFYIDGRLTDRVDQRVRLGAVEEWTIVNLHVDDHIFHIHTNPFQLIKMNGQPLAEPVWLDTVVLPRNGSLTFRSRFLDFTGRFVLHCHMMNHEDLGMMQVVEVYKGP
jgi:FtsP/CotA-like multicopper oxidase with cupredoxin domain